MAFPSVARELWPRETSDLRFRRDSSQQASDLSAQLLARAKGSYFNGGSGPTSNPLYFGRTARTIAAHNLCHHRVQLSDEFAGSVVITVPCAVDQCVSVLIVIHA